MVFNSIPYLILLSLTFIFSRIFSNRLNILLFFSLVFFCYAGFLDVFIFILSVLINWFIINKVKKRKVSIYLGIIFNSSLLLFFKYKSFFIFNNLTSDSTLSIFSEFYPLGISFYCFQAIGYQIDLYKGLTKGAKNFKDFLLFKSFFPQLIAGPIVRAKNLIPKIEQIKNKKIKFRLLSFGLLLLCLGLIKKIVFADSLSIFVDQVFSHIPMSSSEAWIGASLYAFQIYFDFSGYSDLALGSAYLLGFRLPINFRSPYLSTTPSDFWKRWHISLSEWIKDYIYIPLGGSKKGFFQSSIVLIFTMTVAGIWHGGSINFLIWGILWGFYIVLGRVIKINKKFSLLIWPFHIAIVFMLWVLFRAENISQAFSYWKIMLGLRQNFSNITDNLNESLINSPSNPDLLMYFFLLIISMFIFHFIEALLTGKKFIYFLKRIRGLYLNSLLLTLIFLLVMIPDFNTNPFIYFRF